MADFRIRIVLDSSRARAENKAFADSLGNTEKKADSLKRQLGGLFAGLGVGLAIREFTRMADEFTTIQNRLRTVTSSTAELNQVTTELFKIANQTRSSFGGTAEVFARLGLSAKELGRTQQELLDFTKSLNQAVTLSGASAVEAQAGLIQLSQGLASGALRGDELRSVLEQLPVVADVIAKSLGVTRGELRELGAEGKISAEIVLDAFKAARVELDERFGKSVPTIGQAFTVLKNNLLAAAGGFDQATGLTRTLAKVFLELADILPRVGQFLQDLFLKPIAGIVAFVDAVKLLPDLFKSVVGEIADHLNTLVKAFNATAGAFRLPPLPTIPVAPDFQRNVSDVAKQMGEIFRRSFQVAVAPPGQPLVDLSKVVAGAGAGGVGGLPPVEALLREPGIGPELQGRLNAERERALEREGRLGNSLEQQLEAVRGVSEKIELGPKLKESNEGLELLAVGMNSATEAITNFVRTGRLGVLDLVNSIRDATLQLLLQSGARALGLPGFAHGGSFTVGGHGGTDSQTVAFRATPGEQVTVNRPQDINVSAAPVNLRIVNVSDQRAALAALSSPEGERSIMNFIRANRNDVRSILAT